MRIFFITLFALVSTAYAEYSITFIHIGTEIPSHADIAVMQARRFNPNARIIFLGSSSGIQRLHSLSKEFKVELHAYEQLPKTAIHKRYEKLCIEKSLFWRYTSERFLYLLDLMEALSLKKVFHLENDNLLYADLEKMLPIFQRYFEGIGATFDNEDRCIPGFVWIANCQSMEHLAKYFVEAIPKRLSDMYVIGEYRKKYPSDIIAPLPIIMPEYASKFRLVSPSGHTTPRPRRYYKYAKYFNAIFDAAAMGQFLGGIDPIHKNHEPGFINESCLFNPSRLHYEWGLDPQGRAVPYAKVTSKKYKIINLHIHSKRLKPFYDLSITTP